MRRTYSGEHTRSYSVSEGKEKIDRLVPGVSFELVDCEGEKADDSASHAGESSGSVSSCINLLRRQKYILMRNTTSWSSLANILCSCKPAQLMAEMAERSVST